ncbi:helix-turn-helix domain-containing protein [Sphingobacterium thermophilum]|uniref:Helix-turn-helix domain-containing protein n=1 Tax=Sphingobacterium thermophilum TaxID=768534 RepID=A0ABP8QWB5_9SPHI
MNRIDPYPVKTIQEFHRLHGLSQPSHPLISVVSYPDLHRDNYGNIDRLLLGIYVISLKRGVNKLYYGQQEYDFDEGVLYFMAPGQMLKVNHSLNDASARSGWLLLIHPDFLWNSHLLKSIKHYDFFEYDVHEALFLSDKEEKILNDIIANIKNEYSANIDAYSKYIILSHIETLLSYSERFYNRQFITREKKHHDLLDKLNHILEDYFKDSSVILKGLPTVQYLAEELHVSPGYLGKMLRMVSGQSTQQHIQHFIIDKAKELLSTTDLTVSEIAYSLGFEHPQSFSKLFKVQTHQTPLQFRKSFMA